jgi:hypothetical protein
MPEILIEAVFTLVAVLLAFAIEEWREDRELERVALEARVAITQEIRHNHDELLASRRDTLALIAALKAALAEPAVPSPEELQKLCHGFDLALLSSAAWRSAQSMDAARRMEHGWMLRAARAYELQEIYEQAQRDAVGAITVLKATRDDAVTPDILRNLLVRLQEMHAFSETLESDYAGIR